EAHALLEQRLVDELGFRATLFAQPTANKVDHAVCLVGMVAGIGDRQDATARYPSHQHAGGSNIWSASKSRYRGVDVAQTAFCTTERSLGLARIALGTVRVDPFVIFSVRLAAAPALRESDQPASLVQKRRQADIKRGLFERGRTAPVPGRA